MFPRRWHLTNYLRNIEKGKTKTKFSFIKSFDNLVIRYVFFSNNTFVEKQTRVTQFYLTLTKKVVKASTYSSVLTALLETIPVLSTISKTANKKHVTNYALFRVGSY